MVSKFLRLPSCQSGPKTVLFGVPFANNNHEYGPERNLDPSLGQVTLGEQKGSIDSSC